MRSSSKDTKIILYNKLYSKTPTSGIYRGSVLFIVVDRLRRNELYLYYEDLLKGRLDGILDEEEAPIIIKDLTESYIKAFGKDTLDEEDQ